MSRLLVLGMYCSRVPSPSIRMVFPPLSGSYRCVASKNLVPSYLVRGLVLTVRGLEVALLVQRSPRIRGGVQLVRMKASVLLAVTAVFCFGCEPGCSFVGVRPAVPSARLRYTFKSEASDKAEDGRPWTRSHRHGAARKYHVRRWILLSAFPLLSCRILWLECTPSCVVRLLLVSPPEQTESGAHTRTGCSCARGCSSLITMNLRYYCRCTYARSNYSNYSTHCAVFDGHDTHQLHPGRTGTIPFLLDLDSR